MQLIGTIKFVQIQQSSLKEDFADGSRQYNPAPLLKVPEIEISADGVIGVTSTSNTIIDVHNARHPHTRNSGKNPISIGFTSHYNAMRSRFGDHLTDGIAGESIIIDAPEIMLSDKISNKLVIQKAEDDELIHLIDVIPAPPCEPFSRFAANKTLNAQEMKATLQFLNQGMRGYYMKLRQPERVRIKSGDKLFIAKD